MLNSAVQQTLFVLFFFFFIKKIEVAEHLYKEYLSGLCRGILRPILAYSGPNSSHFFLFVFRLDKNSKEGNGKIPPFPALYPPGARVSSHFPPPLGFRSPKP